MTDLSTLHPLLLVAARIALAVLGYPLAYAAARLALGRDRLDGLRARHPFTESAVLLVGLVPFGLLLGNDALDPRLVGPALSISAAGRASTAAIFGLLAGLPLLGGLRAHDAEAPSARGEGPSLAVLFVAAALPFAALLALRGATRGEGGPYEAAALARAPLRAALVPSDADARLSLGFRFASADMLDRARGEAAYARGLGAVPARTYELESEIAARAGDCEGAERLFRLSLESSLGDILEGHATTRLRLGGYFLPPSLVTRCHFGERGASPR